MYNNEILFIVIILLSIIIDLTLSMNMNNNNNKNNNNNNVNSIKLGEGSSSSSSSSSSCQCIAATWDFGKIAVKHGIQLMLYNNDNNHNVSSNDDDENSNHNGIHRDCDNKNENDSVNDNNNNNNRITRYYTALDIIEKSINIVELDTRDQYYVGYGGLPNANGIMELDAAIMDHDSKYGAVMCLQNIKTPISVARKILEKCPHNILSGEGALQWAIKESFQVEDVLTESSRDEWLQWKQSLLLSSMNNTNNDNDNIDGNVHHDSQQQLSGQQLPLQHREVVQVVEEDNSSHDTIGVICLDHDGHLAAGTSTSGWKFKIPGRVGDSPLIGSGLYCDGLYGAAVATGDGEEIMRTCLSFLVVEYMRQGKEVDEACRLGIARLEALVYRPSSSSSPSSSLSSSSSSSSPSSSKVSADKMHDRLTVGVVAMDIHGNVGAASTIDENNLHRGKPYFPVACWRSKRNGGGKGGGVGGSDNDDDETSSIGNSKDSGSSDDDVDVSSMIHMMEASRDGARY